MMERVALSAGRCGPECVEYSSRRGITHTYDIVEGPMADDTIWNYVDDFARGLITRTAFWELVKFKYPTHQIVFCTEEALKCLSYQRSYSL